MKKTTIVFGLVVLAFADMVYAKKDPERLRLKMLYGRDALERADAKKALIEIAPQVVAPLIEDLKGFYGGNDRDDFLRVADVLEVLEHARGASVEPLIELLTYRPREGTDPLNAAVTRSQIAETLGKLKDKRAVEPLLALLRSPDGTSGVVTALGELGDQRAVEPLKTLLHDLENDPTDITKGGPLAIYIKIALRKLEASH